MPTELELTAILTKPEAERTPEDKKQLADFLSAAGRKTDENKEDKRETPATWDEVFKHPRFKELNEAANTYKAKAEALEKANQEAEQKRLLEQNDFKQLYEKTQAELTSLKPKAEQLLSMEKTLNLLLEAEVKSLPEQFQDVVPDGLNTQQKLDWISKNKSKFMKPEAFDIGAGKTGAKKPEGKAVELSPEERQLARDFGMSEDDYVKYKDKDTPAS
jgi:hypothetical protein